MFSHVMLGAADLEASRQFYDAVLAPLGTAPGVANRHRYFWRGAGGTFSVSTPINGQAATHANGGTIGFAAVSTAQVDAFHTAGLAHGGTPCEEPPGWRGEKPGRMYIAYLRDPSGNKICALHREPKDA